MSNGTVSFPQTITVHSSCGGSAKTTIAMYLAYLYAGKGYQTILLELSQYSSVTAWLQLPRNSSTGVVGLIAGLKQGGMTDQRVRSALAPAPAAGDKLHLILSSGAAKMDQITTVEVKSLIDQLTRVADVVVIDTGSELTERAMGAVVAANRVVLPLSPLAAHGWQIVELLEILRSAYLRRDQLGLAFTRVQPGVRFSVEEFEDALGLPAWGSIPDSRAIKEAWDLARPPAITGRDPALAALRRLAHNLIPVFSPKELRGTWRSSK